MSVHRQPNGRYKVKWKEGGRQFTRTFDRKADADRKDISVKRRKQLGVSLDVERTRSEMTFREFVRGPWEIAHGAGLAPKTQAKYRWAREYMRPLRDKPLRALDVPTLAAFQRYLRTECNLSPATTREVLSHLTGYLQIAAEGGHIDVNPMRTLRKERVPAKPPVVPFDVVDVERLIAAADGIDRAILVLGGHLGLRPLEMRLAPWRVFDGETFTVEADKTKPSAARTRHVEVPTVAAAELRAWRLASGGRGDDPVIPMTARQMNAWNPKLRAMLKRAGIEHPSASAYTLRHTHASLLHYATFTIPEAAERMGHSEVVHMRDYAHPLTTLRGKRYADLNAAIAAFRDAVPGERVPVGFLKPR